jgi:hypothetical protein
MSNGTQSKATAGVKQSASPLMTDSSTSTKKPAVDAYLTIEKELYHILNLFKQREKEKEKQFDEWIQKGLNSSTHFFDSHPEFLVDFTEIFSLPPLSNPAEIVGFLQQSPQIS